MWHAEVKTMMPPIRIARKTEPKESMAIFVRRVKNFGFIFNIVKSP
jgi:hypothetical protein